MKPSALFIAAGIGLIVLGLFHRPVALALGILALLIGAGLAIDQTREVSAFYRLRKLDES